MIERSVQVDHETKRDLPFPSAFRPEAQIAGNEGPSCKLRGCCGHSFPA